MRSDELTLALWEGALGHDGARRDEALLGALPRSLPERNLLALRRYAELFGPSAELVGKCTHCGASVEFSIDAGSCARSIAQDAGEEAVSEWHELHAGGTTLRFRLPAPADLHELRAMDDADAFAKALLARCVEGGLPDDDHLWDELSRRIESLMPGAGLSFSLRCPDCGGGWEAPLDPVELLWRELRLRAERLLVDIATLARNYGWSEHEILGLGPVRRAAYLQLGVA